ncbi:hypothetical protein PIB30_073039 [Stylosanthes scabra]|uniref:Uncharacterized protein n=1 Tax=Stylosanthes scabra TaxID=79078 RepID=A0ABU6SQB0_9FABA|nr:hypothetical protein [Stylosanthes scabra]
MAPKKVGEKEILSSKLARSLEAEKPSEGQILEKGNILRRRFLSLNPSLNLNLNLNRNLNPIMDQIQILRKQSIKIQSNERILQMSNSNSNIDSDSSGSVANNAQSSIKSSSHIENVRQNSENTRQESRNQNANGGNGGNSHNSHLRIMQPPFNPPATARWLPYGMPPNFTPPALHSNFGNNSNSAFQFGSIPNSSSQFFPEINRSVGTSSSTSGLSIQTVK